MKRGPQRHVDVHWVVVDGDVVAVDSRDGTVHTMCGATAVVWQLLDGSVLDGLDEEIAAACEMPVARVREDIGTAIRQLSDADLLDPQD
jgi:hypothetical protein